MTPEENTPSSTPTTILTTPATEVNPNAVPATFVPDTTKSQAENDLAKTAFEKTVADKAAADKATADAAAANKVSKDNPFKVEDIKLPEGLKLNEATSKGFVELVNKFGIGRDAAAELVKLQGDFMKAASETGDKQWQAVQEQWQEQTKNDPEIGGDKLGPTTGAISKIIDTYGTPELRQAFDLTGAGNNPHVIKFLAKLAKQLTEPSPPPPPSVMTGNESIAQRMYPNQGKAAA